MYSGLKSQEKYKESSRYEEGDFKRQKTTYDSRSTPEYTLCSVTKDVNPRNQDPSTPPLPILQTLDRNRNPERSDRHRIPEHLEAARNPEGSVSRNLLDLNKDALDRIKIRSQEHHIERSRSQELARLEEMRARNRSDGRSFQEAGEPRSFQAAGEQRSFQAAGEPRNFQAAGEPRSFQVAGEQRSFQAAGEQRSFQTAGEPRSFQAAGEPRSLLESRTMMENLNLEKARNRLDYESTPNHRSMSRVLEYDRRLEGHGGQGDRVYSRYTQEMQRSKPDRGCMDEGGRMGTSDQYCLRWNSYETNILDTFGGLLDSEALSDVTLFCEGEFFKAHRLVLAACSTHFSKIFSISPLNGPPLTVILDGTRAEDLQILLQFMYRGVAFLPSDRIESVLRTGEVLQVKGLFNGDGISRNGRDGGREGARPWSPPPAEPMKKEQETPRERNTSPVPSGRIAVPSESPLTHNLPIFPQQPYPRPFAPSLPNIYPNFPFSRPESSSSKPTSSSVLSLSSTKSGLPSPLPGRDSGLQYKFSPRERERDDPFDVGSNVKPELGKLGRSPPIHRPNSEPFDRPSPRGKLLASGDSIADGGGSSPSQSRRFDEPERQRMKTESSPARDRTFSGEFSDRDTSSRLSIVSNPSLLRSEAAEDLRTENTEERIKRENNQDFLRRLAQVNSERENQLATIQKMDLLRQATARGDHFLAGAGGFGGTLIAPLSIPASDLARIAQTVPDPAAIPGEPISGTGTKLKCPFCERTYGYETNLRAHIRQRHQGIRVPCPFCHRSFTRNNTVRRHIAREHRHQVNPKMIPTKFGQTKVMPDQPYQDAMNQQAQQ